MLSPGNGLQRLALSDAINTRLQIHEKRPQKVKNFGIWIRYDSRSGTHNMYKEYREMSRCEAVDALYQDMAARHRARFRSIHVRLDPRQAPCRRPPLLTSTRRSSRSLRSRRPRTSAAPTSSSSSPRTSSSPFPTVSPRPPARRSSLPTALPPSSKRVAHPVYCCVLLVGDGVWNSDWRSFLTVERIILFCSQRAPNGQSKRTFFSQVYFFFTNHKL